jgi:hypothetical protein
LSTRRLTNLHKKTSKGKENNYAFFVSAYQALHAHTSHSEWIVNSGFTCHISKDDYNFYSLKEDIDKETFLASDQHSLLLFVEILNFRV